MTPPTKHVSAVSIRAAFNASDYSSAIARGELRPELLHDSHLRDPYARGQPLCTRSQVIRYYDAEGHIVVELHQCLQRNNVLGGRPDPKRLLVGTCMLVFHRDAT